MALLQSIIMKSLFSVLKLVVTDGQGSVLVKMAI